MEHTTVYSFEDGRLTRRAVQDCRVDGHVHSLYSGREPTRYVGTPVTKLLGVRESYAEPREVHAAMKRRGLRFCTLSDHDSVLGALAMRRAHPDDTFVSCEYTVWVEARTRTQAIHAGVWGLDLPAGAARPLPDREVLELHAELTARARLGFEHFTDFCLGAGLGFCLNHPAWQGSPRHPLSGAQLDEIADAFPVLEVNGDCQLENLVAIELAAAKRKALCAGTDAHSTLRIGEQYTAPLRPVDGMADFIRAFRDGEIGIGSAAEAPDGEEEPGQDELVRHLFNGTVANLRRDTYKEVRDYLFTTRERGLRKLCTLACSVGLPAALSAQLGPEVTLPALLALEGLVLASVPYIMPRIERMNAAKKTRRLYHDYQRHLRLRHAWASREVPGAPEPCTSTRNLPEMILQGNGWDRILLRLLGGLKPLHNDYDMSRTAGDTP